MRRLPARLTARCSLPTRSGGREPADWSLAASSQEPIEPMETIVDRENLNIGKSREPRVAAYERGPHYCARARGGLVCETGRKAVQDTGCVLEALDLIGGRGKLFRNLRIHHKHATGCGAHGAAAAEHLHGV